jgi:hypothetical protein
MRITRVLREKNRSKEDYFQRVVNPGEVMEGGTRISGTKPRAQVR